MLSVWARSILGYPLHMKQVLFEAAGPSLLPMRKVAEASSGFARSDLHAWHLEVLGHPGVEELGVGLYPWEVSCLFSPQWKDPFEMSNFSFPLSKQTVDDEAMAA